MKPALRTTLIRLLVQYDEQNIDSPQWSVHDLPANIHRANMTCLETLQAYPSGKTVTVRSALLMHFSGNILAHLLQAIGDQ